MIPPASLTETVRTVQNFPGQLKPQLGNKYTPLHSYKAVHFAEH
jgi:hypothetical protein